MQSRFWRFNSWLLARADLLEDFIKEEMADQFFTNIGSKIESFFGGGDALPWTDSEMIAVSLSSFLPSVDNVNPILLIGCVINCKQIFTPSIIWMDPSNFHTCSRIWLVCDCVYVSVIAPSGCECSPPCQRFMLGSLRHCLHGFGGFSGLERDTIINFHITISSVCRPASMRLGFPVVIRVKVLCGWHGPWFIHTMHQMCRGVLPC